MKRFVELIMSLIVTAAAYAVMHIIFTTNLFQWETKLPVYVPTGLAVFTGFIFYFIISSPVAEMLMRKLAQAEERLTKMNLKELAFSILGGFVGLVLANLIGIAFRGFGALGTFIVVLLNLLFGILGIRVARRKKDEVNVRKLQEVLLTTAPIPEEPLVAGRPKILDTSVIIDGRIVEIMKTGFLEGPIVIPEFVLVELRHIADSSDALKRNRGRRGLDILNKIQEDYGIEIYNTDSEKALKDIPEVDVKLLKLAQIMKGKVVTNDFNLNKVSVIKGVPVLNINELANAMKPMVIPGEVMTVTLIKQGKEAGQAVAYLDDGTMIVVEDGRKKIGQTLDINVTSVLQTAAGRMIFGKVRQ